jgi:hypothetical protein
MENLQGEGNGRQCLIDGVITAGLIGLGVFGGVLGIAGGFLAGMSSANGNGCFNS